MTCQLTGSSRSALDATSSAPRGSPGRQAAHARPQSSARSHRPAIPRGVGAVRIATGRRGSRAGDIRERAQATPAAPRRQRNRLPPASLAKHARKPIPRRRTTTRKRASCSKTTRQHPTTAASKGAKSCRPSQAHPLRTETRSSRWTSSACPIARPPARYAPARRRSRHAFTADDSTSRANCSATLRQRPEPTPSSRCPSVVRRC